MASAGVLRLMKCLFAEAHLNEFSCSQLYYELLRESDALVKMTAKTVITNIVQQRPEDVGRVLQTCTNSDFGDIVKLDVAELTQLAFTKIANLRINHIVIVVKSDEFWISQVPSTSQNITVDLVKKPRAMIGDDEMKRMIKCALAHNCQKVVISIEEWPEMGYPEISDFVKFLLEAVPQHRRNPRWISLMMPRVATTRKQKIFWLDLIES